MAYRSIETILPPPSYHWVGNGFKVHNFLPRAIGSNDRMSPFFLLDYNPKMYYPPSSEKRGVGVHPHRGLETVTIAYHGMIAHHDSEGNGGVIASGDVQWMTAGKGILHKEYHHDSYVKSGGDFQMVQLWVNLPAKYKMTNPRYQELPKDILGKYVIDNEGSRIHIISGSYGGVTGPAQTFTDINLFDIKLNANKSIDFSFPNNFNTGLLVIEGEILINHTEKAPSNHFVLFKNDATDIIIEALQNATILFMSGLPINEPLYPYGPFLMNSKEETQKAYDDYHNGDFGYLED